MKKGCINVFCWLIIIAIVIHRVYVWFGAWCVAPAILLLTVIILVFYKNSIFFFLGNITFEKDHKKGFKWFEAAYKTGKMKPQNALFYAYLLLRDGEVEKSAKMIDDICTNQKSMLTRRDFLNSRLNRALIKWKTSDRKGAIEMVQSLYDEEFKTTALYGVLGYLYIEDECYEKALEINKEAYEYNDSDNIITDNLGLNYLMLGNIEESEKIYKNLLCKNPDFIEPYYNYALLLEKKGDKDGALKYLEKALCYKEKFLSTVTHEMIRQKQKELR